jgi:hypothetical protein
MSEKRLWEYLFGNVGHLGHFSRVETHESSAGYPDVSYTIDGFNGHIELKFSKGKRPPTLKPSQSAWFRMRVKHGGRPLVFFGYEENGKNQFAIIQAPMVPDLVKANSVKQWLSAASKVWYNKVNWDELVHYLKNP